MKRVVIAGILMLLACSAQATEQTVEFGRFGKVNLYWESPHPAHVVLFVSGDGGWNLGVVDMAHELAGLDALVVGIDITHYLRELEKSGEACSYPAADFEALSQFVQKKLEFPQYVAPVLVGYSSGATLVYAALIQAPPTTFRGAISLGFCPDLPMGKPMCRGSGLTWVPGPKGKGFSFQPAEELEVPWVALQGKVDQVCNPEATQKFTAQVKNGRAVMLDKVGHGFAVPRNWLPQFKQAFLEIVEGKSVEPLPPDRIELAGLPLVEVPAREQGSDLMAFWITGDGGWGVTDRGVSDSLAARGIPVVALNSLHYFWKGRTPEETAADATRVLEYYLSLWKKQRIILIGYSFGADMMPLLVNHLPPALRSRIALVSLLGLGKEANFEIHVTDWLGSFSHKKDFPVLPELTRLRGLNMQCFYGEEDSDTICRDLPADLVHVYATQSGHRFGKNFSWIVDAILEQSGSARPTRQ